MKWICFKDLKGTLKLSFHRYLSSLSTEICIEHWRLFVIGMQQKVARSSTSQRLLRRMLLILYFLKLLGLSVSRLITYLLTGLGLCTLIKLWLAPC